MPQDLNVALRIRADLKNAVRQIDQLEKELKQTGRAGRQASAGMRAAAADTERAGRAAQGASRNMRLLRGTIAGVGFGLLAREAIRAARGLTDSGLAIERLVQRFTFAAGGLREGAREMQFIRDEAERLGLAFAPAAEGFTSLAAAARGTALEGQAAREIFTSIAEAATVLQLSAEQTNGALTAIEQIISKGKVSAEELRGQLGERLPGAFQIAARSMGVTTAELDEMLVAGELLATDFLPRFAAEVRRTFASEVPAATETAAAEFNRLGNTIDEVLELLSQSGPTRLFSDIATQLDGLLRRVFELDEGIKRVAASGGQGGRAPVAPGGTAPTVTAANAEQLRETIEALAAQEAAILADIAANPRRGARADPRTADLRSIRSQLAPLRAEYERLNKTLEETADATERAYEAASAPLRINVEPPDLEALQKFYDDTDRITRQQISAQLGSVGDVEGQINLRFQQLVNERKAAFRQAIEDANDNQAEIAKTVERQKRFEIAAENARAAAIRAYRNQEAEQRLRDQERASREAERLAEREARAAERASERQGAAARQVFEAIQDANLELGQGADRAYGRAILAADRWRDTNLRALTDVGLAHGELWNQVEEIYARWREEIERNEAAQRTAVGGMREALREYARQAAESGTAAQDAMGRALKGMEDSLVSFVQTGKLEFGSLVDSIVADLARLAIRQSIVGPLASAFGLSPVGVAHSGGVAGQLSRQRAVDPRVFAFAPRYHEGGIAGLRPDEVPAILQRGETVLPRGGGQMFQVRNEVNIVNNGTPQREASRSVRFEPGAMVTQIVLEDLEGGGPIRSGVQRLVSGRSGG